MTTIALISPGAMGASVGAAAVSNGHRVLWQSNNRSQDTANRARRAGLEGTDNTQEMFAQADIVLSICPPSSANEVALLTSNHRFQGIFVETNAISPQRTRSIHAQLGKQGIDCVDGGIIGGPAWDPSTDTQLYLSGDRANDIARVFAGSAFNATVLNDKIGSASALKMTFAAYTKGTTALLAAILAVAEHEGVREFLQSQWGEDFSKQTANRITDNASKAWRFSGEMQEIAATFATAGLPAGFHEAAADVFERLSDFKDVKQAPALTDFLARLTSSD